MRAVQCSGTVWTRSHLFPSQLAQVHQGQQLYCRGLRYRGLRLG